MRVIHCWTMKSTKNTKRFESAAAAARFVTVIRDLSKREIAILETCILDAIEIARQ